MIRLMCVEDDPIVRTYLTARLDLENDIEMIGCFEDAESAFACIRDREVDVALLDEHLRGLAGTGLLQALTRHDAACGGGRKQPAVLFCTGMADEMFEARVLAMGAAGVVPKHAVGEQLVPAIRTVAKGGQWFAGGPIVVSADRMPRVRNVLVGENRGLVRTWLGEILPHIGCSATMVWRTDEVIERLNAERFDLLLLSNRLPGRLLGTDVIEQVRHRLPALPILLLATLANEVAQYPASSSVRGTISSSCPLDELQRELAAAFRWSEGMREGRPEFAKELPRALAGCAA